MSCGALRVINLGGSLLDWPELVPHGQRWLAAQPSATNIVIAGGGAVVEQLRELDRLQALQPESAHWLAIQAMGLSAALVAHLLPGAKLVHRLAELKRPSAEVQVLEVEAFMRDDASSRDPLPLTWEVTSDSIAARVARALEARELVLLKSALPATPGNWEKLSAAGYVDAYFPRAASGLRVRAVNLRDSAFAELGLGAGG